MPTSDEPRTLDYAALTPAAPPLKLGLWQTVSCVIAAAYFLVAVVVESAAVNRPTNEDVLFMLAALGVALVAEAVISAIVCITHLIKYGSIRRAARQYVGGLIAALIRMACVGWGLTVVDECVRLAL